jgi:hypothetical protein
MGGETLVSKAMACGEDSSRPFHQVWRRGENVRLEFRLTEYSRRDVINCGGNCLRSEVLHQD